MMILRVAACVLMVVLFLAALILSIVIRSPRYNRWLERRRQGKKLLAACAEKKSDAVPVLAGKLGIQTVAMDRPFVPPTCYDQLPPREFKIFICYLLAQIRYERRGEERQKAIALGIGRQLLCVSELYRRRFLGVLTGYPEIILQMAVVLHSAFNEATSEQIRLETEHLPAA